MFVQTQSSPVGEISLISIGFYTQICIPKVESSNKLSSNSDIWSDSRLSSFPSFTAAASAHSTDNVNAFATYKAPLLNETIESSCPHCKRAGI